MLAVVYVCTGVQVICLCETSKKFKGQSLNGVWRAARLLALCSSAATRYAYSAPPAATVDASAGHARRKMPRCPVSSPVTTICPSSDTAIAVIALACGVRTTMGFAPGACTSHTWSWPCMPPQMMEEPLLAMQL